MFFFVITIGCHLWMHSVVRRMMKEKAPGLSRQLEDKRLSEPVEHFAAG
jgi:hypothetical protein